MNRKRSAFTIVELLVVIGILFLVVAILIPAINRAMSMGNTPRYQPAPYQSTQQPYAPQTIPADTSTTNVETDKTKCSCNCDCCKK